MDVKRMLVAAAAAIALAGPVAAGAAEEKRTVGEYADDKVLVGKVKAALVSDKGADADEINVEAYKGVVQLNGFVDGQKEKAQAEKVARGVAGVRDVQNNLALKAAPQTAGGMLDDSAITARVKAALIRSPATRALDINVETRGGVVQLSGFVTDAAQKDAATAVAGAVKGVRSVNNALAVR